jgi:hypothetical protein
MDLPVDALLGIFLVEPLDLSLVSVVRTVCKRWNEASAAAINVLVRRMDTIGSCYLYCCGLFFFFCFF